MKPSIRLLLLCVLSFALGILFMFLMGNAYQMTHTATGGPLRYNTRTGEAWTMTSVGNPEDRMYRWVKVSER